MKGKDKVILPIWHNITHAKVMAYSPSLAGRKAVSSSRGLEKIVSEILDVIHPQGSPLIIARDTLLEWGLEPPVITDEYWLNIVEASNRIAAYGAVPDVETWGRWSFPLPPKEGGSRNFGERLAWTAMQLNWVKTAEEVPITILTPPEEVLDFINSHSGLFEACANYPKLLAEYAPQLTIPGMGGDLEKFIEEEYKKSCARQEDQIKQKSKCGSGLTNNNKCPLCDEEWSLRHPRFGNYEPVYVAGEYFSGGIFGPEVSPYDHADHLFWLLSTLSSWMPENIHAVLLEGMKGWGGWLWGYIEKDKGGDRTTCGALMKALVKATEGAKFKWNKRIEDDVRHRIELSIATLNLPDPIEDILHRFLEHQFCQKYIEANKLRKNRRQTRIAKTKVNNKKSG